MEYFKNIKRKNAIKVVDYILNTSFSSEDVNSLSFIYLKRCLIALLMSDYNNSRLIDFFDGFKSTDFNSQDCFDFISNILYFYEF